MAMIQARSVSKHYRAVKAVNGVDLTVQPGEIFGLIGHNGAGKSTLFKMMLGLLRPTSGVVEIESTPVTGRDFRAVRQRIGYLPENVVLYDNLTGRETLHFFARLKSCAKADCERVLQLVGLTQAQNRRVREYSKGMRQRLGFAQALLGQPRLLFLDEPTTGLDPEAIRDFYATLHVLRGEGVTVILTSHILSEIQTRVDRLAIMASGKIQAEGTVQALRESLNLPVQIVLWADDVAGLTRRLADLPVLSVASMPEGAVRVTCERAQKLRILSALSEQVSHLRDIQVLEPSLEDVFFGFKGA